MFSAKHSNSCTHCADYHSTMWKNKRIITANLQQLIFCICNRYASFVQHDTEIVIFVPFHVTRYLRIYDSCSTILFEPLISFNSLLENIVKHSNAALHMYFFLSRLSLLNKFSPLWLDDGQTMTVLWF